MHLFPQYECQPYPTVDRSPRRRRVWLHACVVAAALVTPLLLSAQSPTIPWNGYAHSPQHTAISSVGSQRLEQIHWHAPLDLAPQFSGNDLLIHYGSPVITGANTILLPVKTGASDGFKVEARRGDFGTLLYTLTTDYSLPPSNWTPSFGMTLTPSGRFYYSGAGGTVYYRDQPDMPSGASGQIAFYGTGNYLSNRAAFDSSVKISTPLTSDRFGNLFFGYTVTGGNPLSLHSGIARIAADGTGSYLSATAAAGDAAIVKVATNCAPALSNNQRTLYFAVSTGNFGAGYLVAVNSSSLTPLARVRLKDPRSGSDGLVADDGTASPMIGPDNDVYFGVLENPFGSNHARGWLLHFTADLTVSKTPGAFGWDDTASVVPASLVASYHGGSAYLLLTKYNNYAGDGGDGINKVAILDPNTAAVDPISGLMAMKPVIAIAGPTADSNFGNLPGAVREWCINTAAIDPFTKSALVNSEDGTLYRWDFATNSFTERIVLTPGIGEAYTPTLIGPDGAVYAVNNATLFAVGATRIPPIRSKAPPFAPPR